jgi:GNAT superfamily N-acetyltransferase
MTRFDGEAPDAFGALRARAGAEGYGFLDRLADRWRVGAYQGDGASTLIGVLDSAKLIAIGAQTRDEYEPLRCQRRIRHFYVDADWRRAGVGRMLADALIADGLARAPLLTLRATIGSMAFWDAMGFGPVTHPTRTHELWAPAFRGAQRA